MSLVVWLPLTRDLRQQGLSNVTVTNNGATFNSAGKLGGCYEFASGKRIQTTLPTSTNLNVKAISFACWVNIASWNSSYDALMSIADGTGWQQSRATLCRNNTASTLTWNIADGSTSTRVSTTTSLSTNTWYHIACTYDGTSLKIYLNGVLNNSAAATLSINYAGTFNIGGWSGNNYPLNAKLNDVRIYSHCLSPMEIKQISQGLVLHYTLSDGLIEDTLNYLGVKSNTFTSWRSYGFSSKGAITIDATQEAVYGGQVAKLTNKTTETTNSTVEMATTFGSVASTIMQKNEKFTISAWVKGNDSTVGKNCWLHIYNTNGTNTTSTGSNPTVLTNKWQKIVYTYTWPHDTASNNSGNCYICVSMKGGESIYICNVQIEKKDHSTPFTADSRTNTTVYDNSGFCNNGTSNGTFIISNDTPKYQLSTYMPKTALITHPCPVFNGTDQEWTCAMWVKLDTTEQAGQALNNFNYNNNIVHATNGVPLLYLNAGANDYYNYGNKAVSAGVWTHIAFVFRNSDVIKLIYIDGIEQTNKSGPNKTSTPKGIPDIVTVGTNLAGYISDYRIYATALSAADVKSLYQNCATIDPDGTIRGQIRS